MPRIPEPFQPPLRWAVLGEIASGGMGRVELARWLDGGEVLAVKRLHPHFAADQRFVAMFLDEVWMTGALRHPNVVELAGWGEDDDGMFLAMELVRGASLNHLWRAGLAAGDPIAPELVAYAAARAAEGLAAAHALTDDAGAPLELVHRDVTPSNVLVGFDGSVKITDFGVARAVGRSTRTATGVIKGKVSYMSPEHARGARLDGRSDLYSLGVCIFELSAGARPFHAEHDLEILRLVAEQPAPILAEEVAGFPRPLSDLVRRLLAKDPRERPAHGGVVAAEIDRWLGARDGAAGQRALAAYAARHGADLARRVDALLALPGEIRAMRPALGDDTRVERVGGDVGASPDDPTEIDPPRGFDELRGVTAEAAPGSPASSRARAEAGPRTRPIARPSPSKAAPADDLGLSGSRTRVMEPRTRVVPAAAGEAAEPEAAEPLPSSEPRAAEPGAAPTAEADGGRAAGGGAGATQRLPASSELGSLTRTVRMPEPSRRPEGLPLKHLIAVAVLSFVIVASALSLLLRLAR